MMETLHDAARAVTYKSAGRTVINAAVLVVGAVTLLFTAGIASALFFQNFVPHQLLSSPVYLQYGSGVNPYGVVSLTSPALKSAQEYDISVKLSMPPSPTNIDRGNFMIKLHLLDQDVNPAAIHDAEQLLESANIIFSSRRPTIMPYVDPVISLASRIFFIFYHMLFPSSRKCDMMLTLAERVSFRKGMPLPAAAYLEVESGQTLQTYKVSLDFTARLGGLRWWMHHYRLPVYVIFTFLFWIFELVFMGLCWSFVMPTFKGVGEDGYDEGKDTATRQSIGGKTRLLEKDEDDELSDHPHSFPTYGKQPPLKHEPKVKEEDHERPLSEVPIAGAEADDEDDYKDEEEFARRGYHDSGIGTSYSEEGTTSVRRRASRSGK